MCLQCLSVENSYLPVLLLEIYINIHELNLYIHNRRELCKSDEE